MSLKYAGAQITAAEERRSAASPSIAAPSQLMTASFPLKFMRTTAEAEFREQREFGDGRKRPRVSGWRRSPNKQQGPRRRPDPLSARRRRCYRVGGVGVWGVEGGGEIFTARRVSTSIAVASRVPSSTVMEGGQSGNEDGGNNDCASERVRGRNRVRELKPKINKTHSETQFVILFFFRCFIYLFLFPALISSGASALSFPSNSRRLEATAESPAATTEARAKLIIN